MIFGRRLQKTQAILNNGQIELHQKLKAFVHHRTVSREQKDNPQNLRKYSQIIGPRGNVDSRDLRDLDRKSTEVALDRI